MNNNVSGDTFGTISSFVPVDIFCFGFTKVILGKARQLGTLGNALCQLTIFGFTKVHGNWAHWAMRIGSSKLVIFFFIGQLEKHLQSYYIDLIVG